MRVNVLKRLLTKGNNIPLHMTEVILNYSLHCTFIFSLHLPLP